MHRALQVIFQYPLRIMELPPEFDRRQATQIYVLVPVRLEGHACSLHFLNLFPAQKTWLADIRGIQEELRSHLGSGEDGISNFIIGNPAVVEGQDYRRDLLFTSAITGPKFPQELNCEARLADLLELTLKLRT